MAKKNPHLDLRWIALALALGFKATQHYALACSTLTQYMYKYIRI